MAATITSWIPLTTTFSYPAGCNNGFSSGTSSGSPVYYAFAVGAKGYATCLPSEVVVSNEAKWSRSGVETSTIISLSQIVCPAGQRTARSSVAFDTSSTLVMCCPSAYDLIGTRWDFCSSSVTAGQVLAYSYDALGSGYNTTTVASASTVLADPIFGWNVKQGDDDSTTSTSSSSAQSPTATSSSTSSPSSSTGLSTGAKAGIGVGVAFGAILIGAAILWMFLRHRKHSKTNNEQAIASEPPAAGDYKELRGIKAAPEELAAAGTPTELEAAQDPGELPVVERPIELHNNKPTKGAVHELATERF